MTPADGIRPGLADQSSTLPVAVVGGGLSGLYAAYLLQKAAIDFVLIEGRDYLGGRVLTVNAAGSPSDSGFDLGPSWYWPQMQPSFGALVDQLGLSAFRQHVEGDMLFEREQVEGPQRYRGFQQEQISMRLTGGSASLVRALSSSLSAKNILLRSAVHSMKLGHDHIELAITDSDRKPGTIIARQVILTVPPRLVETSISFFPEQEEATLRLWRSTPTWMAPHAKFVAIYEKPFWRESGLSGAAQSMVGPLAEIHDATASSGEAALFGFIGVPADHRRAVGEEALKRACIDQLGRLFGPAARQPFATLLKDWSADPFTATELDQVASGHPEVKHQTWVSDSWRHHLVFGGSETSRQEPGYLAGAIHAAGLAVTATLQNLEIDRLGAGTATPKNMTA